jgi:ornithine carbamoyltransferase
MASPRHFLTLADCSAKEINYLIQRAIQLKQLQRQGDIYEPLKNRVLAMIFEKSSTRTRVSFESAMLQFGGGAIFLSSRDSQLGRGEPIEDTAKVLSGMVDCVMIRTFSQQMIELFAENSQVPVINGLSDMYHPCQVLADLQTYFELRGSIQGKKVAWIGDGNNMCNSYVMAAKLLDFKLSVACPEGYCPNEALVATATDWVEIVHDPVRAAENADLISTDVWASMGQEQEQNTRLQSFEPYQVNTMLMSLAKPDAIFMHCLPAHRGEEVSATVIDGKQSVVWQQAENRLHSQKALLEFLLLGASS